jgi:hypothetical protein
VRLSVCLQDDQQFAELGGRLAGLGARVMERCGKNVVWELAGRVAPALAVLREGAVQDWRVGQLPLEQAYLRAMGD